MAKKYMLLLLLIGNLVMTSLSIENRIILRFKLKKMLDNVDDCYACS